VYQINQQTSVTGVAAMQNGANVAFYTTQQKTINITGTGNLSAVSMTMAGTGRTYCERLAGTNSLVFRQFDTGATTNDELTVSGLDTLDLSNGNPATMQGMDPTSSNAFTLKGIDISGGLNTNAIDFNGDGTPKAINVSAMEVDWANGSTDMAGADEVGIFLGNLNIRDGMTQLNGDYQLAYWSQNGAKFGNFSGVSIGTDGIVTALFDNGVTRPVFQIPVSTFVNPNGMESLTGNVFIATDNSGEPTLRSAGSAGAGQMNAASLEASTVDIGSEFTTMIVTQRAYSAAAKIITTADQMLDELVQIKR
jgi:flagellar hook protein FlgE